ncbi:siphovirus Gp157 family protein [Lactobacillus terrae]|uniref:siphovirus Gp157 family protein n=1 Tax=Lactobacillus terrae TaxID=2269374 RepID=UPI000C1B6D54|nr:siphovirus Gp157 family protein [Lactobacillus terrae]
MSTLYELTDNYMKLLDYAEDMDPTLFHDTLDSIDEAIEDKAVNYAKVDKELSKDELALKEDIQRLSLRATTIHNNRKKLKNNLAEQMESIGKEKIKTPEFTIWVQNNQPSLNTFDESKVPASYFETKYVLNNQKLKEDLKKGKEVPGATLETGSSLRIR